MQCLHTAYGAACSSFSWLSEISCIGPPFSGKQAGSQSARRSCRLLVLQGICWVRPGSVQPRHLRFQAQ